MAGVSNVKVNGRVYAFKDAEARAALGLLSGSMTEFLADVGDAVVAKGGVRPSSLKDAKAAVLGIPNQTGSGSAFGATAQQLLGSCVNERLNYGPVGKFDLNFTGVRYINDYGFQYRFQRNTALRSVTFPNLTSAGTTSTVSAFEFGFQHCTSLEAVYFPLAANTATSAFRYAFRGCSALSTVSFPALASIGPNNAAFGANAFEYAFMDCTSLREIEFPALTKIYSTSAFSYAFKGCTNLESVSFPVLDQIGGSTGGVGQFSCAFTDTAKLKRLSFPELGMIYVTPYGLSTTVTGTFNGCTAIERIDLPKLKYTYGRGPTLLFKGCTALSEIHFGAANESLVRNMSGFATKWSAPNDPEIYFDL